MRERNFWNFIANKLELNQKVSLLIVAASSDSTPGRKGFKMAVSENGEQFGTIGGGVMEFNLLKKIRKQIVSENPKTEIHRLQHSKETEEEKSGLICGGRQTVIVKYLTKRDLREIKKICENFSLNKNGELVVSPTQFTFTQEVPEKNRDKFVYSNPQSWELTENIGFERTVYVVGNGHVGVAVCRQFSFLGFYTVAFDHRKDIFKKLPNGFADKKIVTSYKNVGDFIIEGEKSYVVIVSPQHTGDRDALASVIRKDVKYIGMMGSANKIKTIFESLLKDGVNENLLSKVHSPIGLDILSETPAEIAVSIAAEVIGIKNKKRIFS